MSERQRSADPDSAAPDPREIARLVAPSLTGLGYQTWNFGDSVGFEALLAASELLGDERWASFGHGWARSWGTRSRPFVPMDCTAPGRAMVELAGRFSDGQLIASITELADYLLGRPLLYGILRTFEHAPLQHPYGPGELTAADAGWLASPPAGVFVDCLHFDPPFLAGLGRATGQRRYTIAAVEQALAYIDTLHAADGLFDHFALAGSDRRFGHGWGRGQGWALLGLLDVVSDLAAEDASDPELPVDRIRSAARDLLGAMIELQRPDGHWHTVVDDPGSGVETSTAAFMATGAYRALRLGLDTGQDLAAAADRAYRAVCADLGDRGMLRGVSAAVMACTELSHYSYVPVGFLVPWGQGPVVLAAAARAAVEG